MFILYAIHTKVFRACDVIRRLSSDFQSESVFQSDSSSNAFDTRAFVPAIKIHFSTPTYLMKCINTINFAFRPIAAPCDLLLFPFKAFLWTAATTTVSSLTVLNRFQLKLLLFFFRVCLFVTLTRVRAV